MITLPSTTITDNIAVFPNAFSPLLCEQLMEFMDNKFAQAKENGAAAGKNIDESFNQDGVSFVVSEKRIDQSLELSKFPSGQNLYGEFMSGLERYSRHYFEMYAGHDLYAQSVHPMQFKCQKSSAGGGFCQWHFEQGNDSECSKRFAVWMIYLNDVTKGGHTEFRHQDISLQPQQGSLVIWPAAYTHVHRAAPDLEQDKYIATAWYVYEASQDP